MRTKHRVTDAERNKAREVLLSIDADKFGEMSRAAEKAFHDGLFPNRSLGSINSIFSVERRSMRREAAKAAEEAEQAAKVETCEQVELFASVPVAEAILKDKHIAEYKLERLKKALIDRSLGLVYDREIKFNFNEITDAINEVWPDEVAEKVKAFREVGL